MKHVSSLVAVAALAAAALVPTNATSVLATTAAASTDQAGGTVLWTATYQNDGYGAATAVAASPDGAAVYVVGTTRTKVGEGHQNALTTVAFSASTGATLWARSLRHETTTSSAIAVSPNGSAVFVTGTSGAANKENSYSPTTAAYNAVTGTRLWASAAYANSQEGTLTGSKVSPDGKTLFVTGTFTALGGTHGTAIGTLAYETTTGALLWKTSYDRLSEPGEGFCHGASLAVSPDGSAVYVTGYCSATKTAYTCNTVTYAATTGARLWKAIYVGPTGAFPGSVPVAISTPNGGDERFSRWPWCTKYRA